MLFEVGFGSNHGPFLDDLGLVQGLRRVVLWFSGCCLKSYVELVKDVFRFRSKLI